MIAGPANGPLSVVSCVWCQQSVLHRYIQAHWRGGCPGIRLLRGHEKACSVCQQITDRSNFSKRSGRRDSISNTCNLCNTKASSDYRAKERQAGAEVRLRPGGWVLRPCETCGEQFSARQMLRHKPRCPAAPSARKLPGSKTEPVDLMKEKADESAANQKRSQKNNNLKWAHGITIEEWEEMLASQNGLCAICGTEPVGLNRRTDSLHVDHCHSTGKNRALLCHFCNLGLGAFRDNTEVLQSAIEYLDTWREKHA